MAMDGKRRITLHPTYPGKPLARFPLTMPPSATLAAALMSSWPSDVRHEATEVSTWGDGKQWRIRRSQEGSSLGIRRRATSSR